jgi:phosphoserine phosphatase
LITGALDFVVAPLRPLFDEIVCASLDEREGRFTGELTRSPPTGEARALLLDEFARAQGLTLGDTVAYADSTSDLPMLEAAGFPVAVNPEAKLAAIARRRGWAIEHWARATGGPRRPLAIATRRPGVQTTPASWLTSSSAAGPS